MKAFKDERLNEARADIMASIRNSMPSIGVRAEVSTKGCKYASEVELMIATSNRDGKIISDDD